MELPLTGGLQKHPEYTKNGTRKADKSPIAAPIHHKCSHSVDNLFTRKTPTKKEKNFFS
jgi:hypothetical protein